MAENSGTGAPATATTQEPSIGELVAAVSRDTSVLMRSEIALAKAELAAEAKKAAVGGGMFGAAGLFGFFGFVFLSFAAVYGIDEGLPTWASFLIVAGSYLLLAGVLALIGLRSLKKMGAPERTIRTTKSTIATLKQRGAKKTAGS